jgi:ketosteroid isomerase-like protein
MPTCRLLLAICPILVTLVLPSYSQQADEILRILRSQEQAWNRKDLDAFMAGYWNSDNLTFFSAGTQISGWARTLERYRNTYQAEGKEMGHLTFSNLQTEPLGTDAAFVRGAWHLTMSDGKTPHGLFTLIWRKFPDGWKIVHDHTSAAD